MDAAALVNVLRRSPIFAALGERDFAELLPVLRQRPLRAGEVLFRQGDPGDCLVVVAKGQLEVQVREFSGHESRVSQLGPGEVSGEMACLDPAPRSATLSAKEDALVLELDRSLLLSLQAHAPAVTAGIISGIITQLNARLRETNQRIAAALGPTSGIGFSGIMPRSFRAKDLLAAPPRPEPYRGQLDLKALKELRALTERDLELLLSVAPPVRYPDKALLCSEGQPGSTCFILAQGAVEVLKVIGQVERVMATLFAGAMVGQMALISQDARTSTVRAKGEVVVLPLAQTDFAKLLKAKSPLALRFQEQIAVAGIRQLRMATVRLATVLKPPEPGSRADLARFSRHRTVLSLIGATLEEWNISPDELSEVSSVHLEGVANPSEAKGRSGRR